MVEGQPAPPSFRLRMRDSSRKPPPNKTNMSSSSTPSSYSVLMERLPSFSEPPECPICNEHYDADEEDLIPRNLACGHSMCSREFYNEIATIFVESYAQSYHAYVLLSSRLHREVHVDQWKGGGARYHYDLSK